MKKQSKAASDEEGFSEEDEWAADRAKQQARKKSAHGDTRHSNETRRESVRDQLQQFKDRRELSGEASSSDDDSQPQASSSRGQRHEIQSRADKHAPTELSSRRAVSRRRNVVDTPSASATASRRDPRFSNLSGRDADAGMFSKSYAFLNEARTSELSTLRATYNKLRKLEANHAGPRASSESALKIREERERVERTLKREEAKEAERKKRQREQEILSNFKRENEERVQKGGKRYYLKDSAKKDLFLQDKFSKLAGGKKSGGHGSGEADGNTPSASSSSSSQALRKAIEKRRKKTAAKERKQMPFLEGGRRGLSDDGKRRTRVDGGGAGGGQERPQKRKRGARGAGSRS